MQLQSVKGSNRGSWGLFPCPRISVFRKKNCARGIPLRYAATLVINNQKKKIDMSILQKSWRYHQLPRAKNNATLFPWEERRLTSGGLVDSLIFEFDLTFHPYDFWFYLPGVWCMMANFFYLYFLYQLVNPLCLIPLYMSLYI